MEQLLDLARGPLFRLTFFIMILGLARNLFLSVYGIIRVAYFAGQKSIPWGEIFKRTIRWLIPVERVGRARPLFSIISVIFHIGLILVPVFLFRHIDLWYKAIGLKWVALPKGVADTLTLITLIAGILIFIGRIGSKHSRAISSLQDYLWIILLLIPFASGYLCAHPDSNPFSYDFMMLIHILAAELIFVMIPFTKLSHIVLLPLSQLVSEFGWRFPADSPKNFEAALGKKGGSL